MENSMKRKRDIQGKFTLKNDDYRRVRSLRLTDSTWKELGIAAECLGITRADLLENLFQQNQGVWNYLPEFKQLTSGDTINREKLAVLAEKVLKELRLGKQSNHYQVAQLALKRLIELAFSK
jgi:histidyl-tRNA synthetase